MQLRVSVNNTLKFNYARIFCFYNKIVPFFSALATVDDLFLHLRVKYIN